MPKFICLTDESDKRPVWVDPNRIVTMEEFEDESGRFTRVQFGYGSHRDFSESVITIRFLIDEVAK